MLSANFSHNLILHLLKKGLLNLINTQRLFANKNLVRVLVRSPRKTAGEKFEERVKETDDIVGTALILPDR